MKLRRTLSLLLTLALITGACSRSDEESSEDSTPSSDDGDAAGAGLDEGAFGDLEDVCAESDIVPAADEPGITDTEITLGTVTDKGFADRPGLNKEMYDAGVAFAEWCNEHGGIAGRDVVIDDLDAKIFEYNARILEACERDFMLVGGGAVLDDADGTERIDCGLAAIPGYAVTPKARVAELSVQPVPNPVYSLAAGAYRRVAELHPDATERFALLTGNLGTTVTVRDMTRDALEQLDFTVVYSAEYATIGETGWRGFVQQMKADDVKGLEFIGEPTNLVKLQEAMQTEGWYPEVMIQQTNFYDSGYSDTIGANAGNTLIRGQYHLFEQADEHKATQDYLDLMEEYNPDGKIAQLGMQALSAFLLFAQAAKECTDELSRECILEKAAAVDDWTGGGMHAPQDPGGDEASPCFLLATRRRRRELQLRRGRHGAHRRRLQLRSREPGGAAEGLRRPASHVASRGRVPDRHRQRGLHRRDLRDGGNRPRPDVHDHGHLQLRPRRDRHARRVLVLAAARGLGLAGARVGRRGPVRPGAAARPGDRARRDAQPARCPRDRAARRDGQPARGVARRGVVAVEPAAELPDLALLPR